jgi:hypothetical protein
LPGQDSGFGSEVVIKKSFVGVMQKGRRSDDFIEDHEGSGHQGTGFKLEQRRNGRARLQVVYEDGPAAAHGFGGNGALLRQQPDADETLGQFAIGLLANEFVAGVTAPEINPTDLEELAGGLAKELNQGSGVGAFRSFGGDPQKEFLKGIVGIVRCAGFRRHRRIAFGHLQKVTAGQRRIFMILTSD